MLGRDDLLLLAYLNSSVLCRTMTSPYGVVPNPVEYEPYAETRQFYRSRGFVDHCVDAKFFGEGEDRYDRLLLRQTHLG